MLWIEKLGVKLEYWKNLTSFTFKIHQIIVVLIKIMGMIYFFHVEGSHFMD